MRDAKISKQPSLHGYTATQPICLTKDVTGAEDDFGEWPKEYQIDPYVKTCIRLPQHLFGIIKDQGLHKSIRRLILIANPLYAHHLITLNPLSQLNRSQLRQVRDEALALQCMSLMIEANLPMMRENLSKTIAMADHIADQRDNERKRQLREGRRQRLIELRAKGKLNVRVRNKNKESN
jgi:hypothetical protein